MSVLINMDMPKNCGVCELCGCYTESKGEVHRCDISMYVIKDLERRLDDCPLIEVVQCKDCKHWYNAPVADKFNSCEKDALIRHETFFCASGERRTEE